MILDLRAILGEPLSAGAGIERFLACNGVIVEATGDRILLSCGDASQIDDALEEIFPASERGPLGTRGAFAAGGLRLEHVFYGELMLSRMYRNDELVQVSLSRPRR